MSSSSLYIKFETWRWPHLDWGTVLSTKRKMAFSEGSWMRFLMIHMNWATVMSEGTRYFLLSMSTIWDPQTFSTITWNAQVNRSVPVFGAAHAQLECPTFEKRTAYMFLEYAGQERKSHSVAQTWLMHYGNEGQLSLWWPVLESGGFLVQVPMQAILGRCSGSGGRCLDTFRTLLWYLWASTRTSKCPNTSCTHVQLSPERNNVVKKSHLCDRKRENPCDVYTGGLTFVKNFQNG